MVKALRAFKPEGFNVGANIGRVAGAGVPGHFHIHVVPRWNGDTNFMPVLGDTKVISESLEVTYKKIKESLEKNCASLVNKKTFNRTLTGGQSRADVQFRPPE